jgi:hypothetical protein
VKQSDTTEDESSHHSSDETEILSSSDHDADSSEYDEADLEDRTKSSTSTPYLNFATRVTRKKPSSRSNRSELAIGPFVALPPLAKDDDSMPLDLRTENMKSHLDQKNNSESSTTSAESEDTPHLIHLSAVTRPIDLTTDHSAYNPAEVTAVLRRCNNAPRAISAGVGK